MVDALAARAAAVDGFDPLNEEARLSRATGEARHLLAIEDERWGHRIVAVTLAALDLEAVTNRLRGRLGPAALPRELRQVAALAYTPTGKIDRRALARAWQEG